MSMRRQKEDKLIIIPPADEDEEALVVFKGIRYLQGIKEKIRGLYVNG